MSRTTSLIAVAGVALLLGTSAAHAFVPPPPSARLTASAASSTTERPSETKDALIARLKARVAELEQMVARLRTSMGQGTGTSAVSSEHLRMGASGDAIRQVQEMLRGMPDVYPSGLVTGYFGQMTKEAIMKFQKKHGLPETGELDAETRAKIESMRAGGEAKPPLGHMMSRFNNGKGIPVCTIDGDERETEYADDVAEFRTLIAAGGKPGSCNKSDSESDDEESEEDEDDDDTDDDEDEEEEEDDEGDEEDDDDDDVDNS